LSDTHVNLQEVNVASIAQECSLFEIDRELDALLDEIEEEIENRGEASAELVERFQQFCEAHGEKADRIGRFLRMMEARVQYCRSEASRLQERARSSERKATQTKYMVMYYLKSHDLKKIEGREFTLRIQRNSQDSVRFTDETQVPIRFRTVTARLDGALWERLIETVPEDLKRPLVTSIQEAAPSNEAIKNAVQNQIPVPGADLYRGDHLRVA
jgi:Siphovirus Gp157